MRVADETRWRGQSAVATAAVVVVYWVTTWVVGETIKPLQTGLAFAATALPTLIVASRWSARRVRESLARSEPPPRASVHETHASARDRRARLLAVVLTGIVALLIFERFSGGGGEMAGLVAGLLGALGVVDWVESTHWAQAERQRESRLFVLVRADALTPRIGAADVYESPRPGRDAGRNVRAGPFDLGI